MSKNEIMNKMTRSFNKVGFSLKKHSPEILVVSGVIGTVTSAVLACKATTKISSIVDHTKEQMDIIHESAEAGEITTEEGVVPYTEEDKKRDTFITYAKSGAEFAKLYGPAVLLGTVSITSILVGHNILRKRNLALAAAYATIDKGFKEYRNRVIERFGKEVDKELRYNIKAKEAEEIVTDKKTGEDKTVKAVANTPDPNAYSDYARFFDCYCKGFCKDPEANLMFLKRQQDYANDKLKRKGYLFLNEVYDMLGIAQTVAGQCVAWVYDEKNPMGDNYVDFGIYNSNDATRRFVNGLESIVLLDFNVDGNILNRGILEL